MSTQQVSATLTGALLANKGAAAPSDPVSGFLEEFPGTPAPRNGNVCADVSPPTVAPLRPNSEPKQAQARTKLSLRLDPERHLKLKLAAAHQRRSSQAILLDALDAYLATVAPELDVNCPCLEDGA